MLAASLTDKLTGRERYEIISIGISRGAKNIGTPGGKKIEKNFKP
jgi:hypothetical protein